MKRYSGVAFIVVCAAVLSSQPSWREHVGPQADGSFLLSNGWRLKPAGAQVDLDTLPMASVLSKDKKYLLVLNNGFRPPSVIVIDTASWKEVSRTPVADAWLGLAVSPDGARLYAAELYHDSVAVLDAKSGEVLNHFKTGRRPYRILFHPGGKAF